MYHYTSLNQDGTITDLGTSQKKWAYDRIKTFIGNYIECIPVVYFPKGMTGQVIGDEEARYNAWVERNPHMKVITDPFGQEWDCVGTLLLEQTEKQYAKWQELLKLKECNGVHKSLPDLFKCDSCALILK